MLLTINAHNVLINKVDTFSRFADGAALVHGTVNFLQVSAIQKPNSRLPKLATDIATSAQFHKIIWKTS